MIVSLYVTLFLSMKYRRNVLLSKLVATQENFVWWLTLVHQLLRPDGCIAVGLGDRL
jgi:hypothetical protein